MLLLIGKEAFAKHYNVFVDVGAASYGENGGDLALSFIYIAFPANRKTIMAFEPFKMKYDQLLEMLQMHKKKYKRDDTSLNYILKNIGVGMSNQTMTFRGKRSVMTANKRIMLHPWYQGKEVSQIECTTIELEAQEAKVDNINILKTDTEGLEWEVLIGSKHLLQEKKIDLIIYAYEDKWTMDSFSASYPYEGTVIKDQSTFDTPNLQSISTWLHSMGYVSYLIGKSPKEGAGFVAIPVTAEYWDDNFEVARDPKAWGIKHPSPTAKHYPTWLDAISVQENSPLQKWIDKQSYPFVRVSC